MHHRFNPAILFLGLLGLLVLPSATPSEAQSCPSVVWSDEFSGSAVDPAKWEMQIGDGCSIGLCGWGNNELQYYKAENATVSGGTLKITAKKERVQGKSYTSARMRTLNRGDFTFGRFEARIKMSVGKGIWPAWWMLPTDQVYGGWPQSGEIDLMENIGSEPSRVHGTLHYGQPYPNNRSTGATFDLQGTARFADAFHEFAVERKSGEIRFFVDGILFGTKTPADLSPENWPFDERFHFLLNLAVGGNWPGNPDATTTFPQVLEVDYVRVYNGYAPFITGDRLVPYQSAGQVYSIGNVPANTNVTWTVPAGATIVSGQGTPNLTVNWGSQGGNVVANVAWSCGAKTLQIGVEVEPPLTYAFSFQNFDSPPNVVQGPTTGVLQPVANPSPTGINTSPTSGAYYRNGGEQYDTLYFSTSSITDASQYVSKQRKFLIDVYTSAPIGSTLILQLETPTASPTNFPTGRHSRYTATTTARNAWERLELTYLDRPDSAASSTGVDEMVLLFAPNTFTSDVYTWDNLDSYISGSVPPPPPSCKAIGQSCSSGTECCSGTCSSGAPSSRVCR